MKIKLPGLLILAAFMVMATAGSAQMTQPELKTPIRAILPLALQNLSLVNPMVEARVEINDKGKVTDLVVLEAAHWGLIDRTRSLLMEARFDPARENGKPITVRIPLKIRFMHPAEVGLGNRSAMDAVEAVVADTGRQASRYKMEVSGAKDLDKPLKVVKQGDRYVPETDDGEPVGGKAVISFYVDDQGQVRLPEVDSSSDPRVAQAAVLTLKGMRFAPPTVDEHPTVVKVAMPFNYKAPAGQE